MKMSKERLVLENEYEIIPYRFFSRKKTAYVQFCTRIIPYRFFSRKKNVLRAILYQDVTLKYLHRQLVAVST